MRMKLFDGSAYHPRRLLDLHDAVCYVFNIAMFQINKEGQL